MQDLCGQLTELKRKLDTGDYRDNLALANRLGELIDIVAALANRVDRVDEAARTAANTASCLANGIKPD